MHHHASSLIVRWTSSIEENATMSHTDTASFQYNPEWEFYASDERST